MHLVEALFTHLTTAPAATQALIGTRLYPNLIPNEAAFPAAAYQVISTPERWIAHGGPTELAKALIQFTLAADTYLAAHEIARALRLDLDGYSGLMSSVEVERAHVENELDDFELTDADVVRVDVSFIYKEQ